MGNIINKLTGADKAKEAAEREAKKAAAVQKEVAAQEETYRQEQENLQKSTQALEGTGAQTATVIAGGSADISDVSSSDMLNKRKRGGGLASAVGLNV